MAAIAVAVTKKPTASSFAGTPYGSGTQASPGTWTDGGGDGTAFLRLNVGAALDQVWRFVKTADDAGANHTPGGAYRLPQRGAQPDGRLRCQRCSVG